MPLFTLQAALANYQQERARVTGPYPAVGCPCPICDMIRAADLLYETAKAEAPPRWGLPPLPPGPGGRLMN